MIATVRIAPCERWCEQHRLVPRIALLAGITIKIDTSSMLRPEEVNVPCGGRVWKVLPESIREAEKIMETQLDSTGGTWWVCEHILEID